MTWEGNSRTSTSAWRKVRTFVLKRDRQVCQLCGLDIPPADTVDHKIPWSLGGTDHPDNLQAAHDRPCHRAKTAAEGTAARSKIRAARFRPPEPHPGLKRPGGDQ